MNQTVSFSHRYSVSDLTRLALFIRNQSFIYRYDAILVGILIFLVMAIVVLLMANDLREIRILALVIFSLIPAIIVGGAVYFLHRFYHPWKARRRLEKYFELYPIMHSTLEIEISDEGISSTGELSSSLVRWPAFVKALESKTDLIFYTTATPGIFVPKSALDSEEKIVSLKAIVTEHLGGKAMLI